MRYSASRIIALSASVAVAGCAVGPNYRRPEVATPVRWKTAADGSQWKEATPRDTAARGFWWTAFNDQTLNDLEDQALEANQSLKAAAQRVVQARAIARISAAEWLPTLAADGSYQHALRSLSSFGGVGSIYTDTFQAPLDLSYEVDVWGRVRRSFQAARAEAQASEADFHTVLLTLSADVATNYFSLRELDSELQILQETLALRKHAQDLVQQRTQAGIVSGLDLARVKTELAAAEADLLDVRRRRAEFENALAVLCGQSASEFRVAAYPLIIPPPRVPPNLPSEVLERRPDVAQAERKMAAASERIGVAQAAFFPVVRLTGSAGYVSTDLDTIFSWENHVWSIGPSVSVPLFAGGRNVAGVNAARARYEEAVANYRQQVLVAFKDVENALAGLQLREEQARAQDRGVAAARDAAELSRARYAQGLVNFLEVVDAERSRLQAERAAVQIESQRLISTVLLIKALGGSWD